MTSSSSQQAEVTFTVKIRQPEFGMLGRDECWLYFAVIRVDYTALRSAMMENSSLRPVPTIQHGYGIRRQADFWLCCADARLTRYMIAEACSAPRSARIASWS